MKQGLIFAAAMLAAATLASPASAAHNVIKNGSFEAGPLGAGSLPSWTKTNTPDGTHGQGDQASSVIGYNNNNSYPTGAYGELVHPDNAPSASPDAVGTQAEYFVGDQSVNETISQLTYLGVGNYRLGFSYYLTANGLANVNNSSLDATIIGVPVASTSITNASTGQTWFYASGVASISLKGLYRTSFVYNSNGYPAKDIVVDRVFAVATSDPATVIIPPTPSAVPEPASWALLIAGFGLVGAASRRRNPALAA